MKNKIICKTGILIAPGELFLKSEGVKKIFKRKLIHNIEFFLRKEKIDFNIVSFRGRIFIETSSPKKALKIIKKVFGITWLSGCMFFPKASFHPVRDNENKKNAQRQREQISNGVKQVSEFIDKNYAKWINENETFALRIKKDKNIAEQSTEKVIQEIAKNINRKVNLSKPQKQIFIEIRKQGWFLYFKKTKGLAGLPIGSSGKAICLMSGGIDSPVAAYSCAKRGVENIWLHFHSFPFVSNTSIIKVKELGKIFLNYQPRLKIYFIPFHKIQMQIKTKTLPKYRILLYRRLMLRIAEQIAKKENCEALITGESLGQVSSQTLSNINIIARAIKIPILRPLIGMDKIEIINLAKKIKTYQVSIKPQEDCCTLFVPKHATAKGKIEIVKELEKKLDIKKMIAQTIKSIEVAKY